jgi:hypothetical protein
VPAARSVPQTGARYQTRNEAVAHALAYSR